MIRRREYLVLCVLLAIATSSTATVFSGEVRLANAQPIPTPQSLTSPVVLRSFVPDGQTVKTGDPLVRVDASYADGQVHKLESDLAQAAAKSAKALAELQLKLCDAKLALADAQAERDTAAVDAAIPKRLESALNYDRYQGEIKRTERALALKREEAAQAAVAVEHSREDGRLELEKTRLSMAFYRDQVEHAVVYAKQDGVVVHGFDNLLGAGRRYEEGSSAYPGMEVGEVIGPGNRFSVRAWVLEPDRTGLKEGQPVWLDIDALPGHVLKGRIVHIAGALSTLPQWGDGRYYQVDIALPDVPGVPLRPGMSVRVDTASGELPTRSHVMVAGPVRIDGEIYAQRSIALSPPNVDGFWRLVITHIAGDGETVKKGDTVVVFNGTDVRKSLTAKQGELDEKLRKQEQTRLDLADREHEAELATAKAKAELEKAQRKADEPREYVAGVQYAKLVIARTKAERRLALTLEREKVATRERLAEQQLADAEVADLTRQVNGLKASLAALTVKAPRDGIVLNRTDWDGNKFDVGSSAFVGMAVAQMPDLATLAVRASLPERDLLQVHRGQRVRVVLAGGGERSVGGSVAEIGGAVHSKSRVDAVPVVDLVVTLDANQLALKPGQTVQVELSGDAAPARSQVAP